MIRPVAATIEPKMVILRQPNFLTRLAAMGPTQSDTPIWTEDMIDIEL